MNDRKNITQKVKYLVSYPTLGEGNNITKTYVCEEIIFINRPSMAINMRM